MPPMPAARSTSHQPLRTGTRMPTSSAPSTHSLSIAPYWIMAKSGPPWSSTMTSWIIVSSRCVLGSSTGMRAFSARKTISSAAATSSSAGPAGGRHGAGRRRPRRWR